MNGRKQQRAEESWRMQLAGLEPAKWRLPAEGRRVDATSLGCPPVRPMTVDDRLGPEPDVTHHGLLPCNLA